MFIVIDVAINPLSPKSSSDVLQPFLDDVEELRKRRLRFGLCGLHCAVQGDRVVRLANDTHYI